MYNSRHTKFILSSLANVLNEAVSACNSIGDGIETQPLSEYIFQTTFLKMTGASEQKMKCICWEMATNDYRYRYQFLRKNYGECSSYDDKNSIYFDLIQRIRAIDGDFSISRIFEDIDISSKENELIERKINQTIKSQEKKKGRELTDDEKKKLSEGMKKHLLSNGVCNEERLKFCKIVLFEQIQTSINGIVGNTMFTRWNPHEYLLYKELWNTLSRNDYASEKSLLSGNLVSLYTEIVYEHRNRCAHNLQSYQDNLPQLKFLCSNEHVYDNYYFRFSILLLIDDILIRLYKVYIELLTKENI